MSLIYGWSEIKISIISNTRLFFITRKIFIIPLFCFCDLSHNRIFFGIFFCLSFLFWCDDALIGSSETWQCIAIIIMVKFKIDWWNWKINLWNWNIIHCCGHWLWFYVKLFLTKFLLLSKNCFFHNDCSINLFIYVFSNNTKPKKLW